MLMCSMGPISNKRYLKSWKSAKNAARFVKQDYRKYNNVKDLYMNLAGKAYKIEEKIKD